jgi:hypothetical protein
VDFLIQLVITLSRGVSEHGTIIDISVYSATFCSGYHSYFVFGTLGFESELKTCYTAWRFLRVFLSLSRQTFTLNRPRRPSHSRYFHLNIQVVIPFGTNNLCSKKNVANKPRLWDAVRWGSSGAGMSNSGSAKDHLKRGYCYGGRHMSGKKSLEFD